MPPTNGRLEARIKVPTGGWTFSINDSGAGGAVTGTVAAGYYYISGASGLVRAFQDALNTAATTDAFLVTIANGENGTGKVAITSTGAGALSWVSTDLRDILGYTADLTLVANTANTATNQAKALWLPDCAYRAPNVILPFLGFPEADARSVESAGGALFSAYGQKKETTSLEWQAIKRNKAVKYNETTTNESFQRFLEEGIWGTAAWATTGGPMRFFPDADDLDYVTYAVPPPKAFMPQPLVDSLPTGPWRVGFERLIVQGSAGEIVTQQGPPTALTLVLASNQSASVIDSAPLDLTTAISCQAWIKPGSNNRPAVGAEGYRAVLSKIGGSLATNSYWCLVYHGTDGTSVRLTLYLSDGVQNVYLHSASIAANLYDGEWHHAGWKYDASAGGTQALRTKFYLDGTEYAFNTSSNGSVLIATMTNSTAPLRIGGTNNAAHAWDGKIADVRLWSTARSAAEMASTTPLAGAEAGLVGYWPLYTGYSDSGPNALTLTGNNSPTFT